MSTYSEDYPVIGSDPAPSSRLSAFKRRFNALVEAIVSNFLSLSAPAEPQPAQFWAFGTEANAQMRQYGADGSGPFNLWPIGGNGTLPTFTGPMSTTMTVLASDHEIDPDSGTCVYVIPAAVAGDIAITLHDASDRLQRPLWIVNRDYDSSRSHRVVYGGSELIEGKEELYLPPDEVLCLCALPFEFIPPSEFSYEWKILSKRYPIVRRETLSYTADLIDDIHMLNGGIGMTCNLQSAALQKDRKLEFRNMNGTTAATIDPDGSEQIDGGATYNLGASARARFISDGTKWDRI